MEDMLGSLFEACESDEACSKAYPDFRSDFHDVLEQARKCASRSHLTAPIDQGTVKSPGPI